VTRVYRDQSVGITYVERGRGAPAVFVPDHGDPDYRWEIPTRAGMVYDDELHACENEALDDARDRLNDLVGKSKLPATIKAEVRKMISAVLGGPPTGAPARAGADEPIISGSHRDHE
jgi:hypothetical protein